jgi:hypothetical protein
MRSNRTSVREARKNLSHLLNIAGVAVIGDHYHIRGFIIGIPQCTDGWNTAERKKRLAEAKRQIRKAIDAEME